jgi:4-methylaminobutanoate oxidase (formaldehyde-forming)
VRAGSSEVVGYVTSGGYGYTVRRSIAYALLPAELGPGASVQVQVDGEWCDAEVVRGPLYDPKGDRVRA